MALILLRCLERESSCHVATRTPARRPPTPVHIGTDTGPRCTRRGRWPCIARESCRSRIPTRSSSLSSCTARSGAARGRRRRACACHRITAGARNRSAALASTGERPPADCIELLAEAKVATAEFDERRACAAPRPRMHCDVFAEQSPAAGFRLLRQLVTPPGPKRYAPDWHLDRECEDVRRHC